VNLGRAIPLLGESVDSTDVLLGMGAGLIASAAVKAALKNFAPQVYAQIASTAGMFLPALTGAAGAAAVYFGGTKLLKMSPHKASGLAVGAVAVGGALSLWDFARANLSGVASGMLDFSGTVGVNLGHNPYGMLIDDSAGQGVNGMGGLIVADHSDGLAELAAISMGPDDDGIDALLSM
jgi:hypothetical protein